MKEDNYFQIVMEIIDKMRQQYPSMTFGDMQSIAAFSKLLYKKLWPEGGERE